MKKLILLLLLAVTAQAQVNIGDLITRKEMIIYVDSVIKAQKPTLPTVPTDTVVVVPNPESNDCLEGPTIKSIYEVGHTSAKVQFHGVDVFELRYEVRNDAGVIGSGSLKPSSNIFDIKFDYQESGVFRLIVYGVSCNGQSEQLFEVYKSESTRPDVDQPTPNESIMLGAYATSIGGRNYTYNKTPELVIAFSEDGKISDVTPNLDRTANVYKLGGKNVFYAISNTPLETESGEAYMLSNTYLPDGIYTINQYVCDAKKVPDFKTFKEHFEGWNGKGVNADNCHYSRIFLSIHSDKKEGISPVPEWLVVSRQLNWPYNTTKKDWRKYYKFNDIGVTNLQDDPELYKQAGANVQYSGSGGIQSASWRTDRLGSIAVPSPAEFYSHGTGNAILMGNNINASISSEFEENTQGTGGDINMKMVEYYRGFYDQIKKVSGETDARKMGAFGDYGGDQWYNVYGAGMDKGYTRFIESLNTNLYDHYDFANNRWVGESNYYKSGAINYRNLNYKQYYYNAVYRTPYNLVYLNERIKLGTKTYEGKDRERNLILFTSPKIESFVADFTGGVEKRNWIESVDTGEIIPFENGEILSKMNQQPPAPWEEMFTASLWANIISGGVINWDAPNSFLGYDATKFHFWGADWQAQWKPKGATEFTNYVSGVSGAPVNSEKGLMHRLYASPQDAHLAAADVAYDIMDRLETINYVAYTSNRNSFKPISGLAGFNLNGFGSTNKGSYNIYNIYNDKKGLALKGSGSGGDVIIYYNGFLSPQLYEDVEISGKSFRAYGKQTVIIKL